MTKHTITQKCSEFTFCVIAFQETCAVEQIGFIVMYCNVFVHFLNQEQIKTRIVITKEIPSVNKSSLISDV